MKILRYSIFAIFLVASCREANRQSNEEVQTPTKSTQNTIVGSRPITHEIAGSAYRKRATGYFVITEGDTSSYMPIFTEAKSGGQVVLELNISYLVDSLTFRQRLNELVTILRKASSEYDFDSLNGIFIGRLIQTGDLAIEITKQYNEQIGAPSFIRTVDYENISKFLGKSKLADEFNILLEPYSLTVGNIGVEKVFFTHKEELVQMNIATVTDTSDYPDKILDCLTSVALQKK